MDYKKKYKDANNKVAARFGTNVAKEIFSDLYESEDERIRKALIDFFEDWRKNRSHCWGIAVTDILAWLEKQGESYTKRDVDDAYVEGMAFAKDELEKQKSWSEEDDSMFQSCIGAVATNDYYKGEEKEQIYDWLKSIKQRIGG